jgi:hydrogenase maturation protein HypF
MPREYENPADRRFHAQPTCCPRCGPRLALWDAAGATRARDHEALLLAAEALRRGEILALKGLGGFQLLADARDEAAVRRLRQRKRREEKPFALLFPTLEAIEAVCAVSELERRLLLSPEAPITLLDRRSAPAPGAPPLAFEAIAPRNPTLGAMLPYTPLHHLLMRELGFPVICTSGNLSDEPICIEENEALTRLRGVADALLVHNRPIARHVDDSVARVAAGRELLLRRARGYAPLPLFAARPLPPALATGAHLKNTVAIAVGDRVFSSQHIGDLESAEALAAHRRALADLAALYNLRPQEAACDLHPDYYSTRTAEETGLPVTRVQHHFAHLLACMAKNGVEDEAILGVTWDGVGYGRIRPSGGASFWFPTRARRLASGAWRACGLSAFQGATRLARATPLALGILHEMFGRSAFERRDLPCVADFSAEEIQVIAKMLERDVNSPRATSAGRLFDAAASLAGLRQRCRFEGQAAMELEFALGAAPDCGDAYPLPLLESAASPPRSGNETFARDLTSLEPTWRLDWEPLMGSILSDAESGAPLAVIATRFHNALAEGAVQVAARSGLDRVALTGGCFQNRYLLERCVKRLKEEGFRVCWPQRLPPNDGSIAAGQLFAFAPRAAPSAEKRARPPERTSAESCALPFPVKSWKSSRKTIRSNGPGRSVLEGFSRRLIWLTRRRRRWGTMSSSTWDLRSASWTKRKRKRFSSIWNKWKNQEC